MKMVSAKARSALFLSLIIIFQGGANAQNSRQQPGKQTQRFQQGKTTPHSGTGNKPVAGPERQVAVFGEVAKGGLFPFTAGMRVRDVIGQAGGFAAEADVDHVNLRRLSHKEVATLNGSRALEGDPIQNAVLEPGDTIYVPRKAAALRASEPPPVTTQSPIGPPMGTPELKPPPLPTEPRVVILGAIVRPGTYLYEKSTVRQAIDALGGPTPDAETSKVMIYRNMLNGPSVLEKKPFDYRKVTSGKAHDLDLMPGDVVELPVKGGRRDFFTQTGNGIRSIGNAMGRVINTQTLIGALPVVGPLLGSAASNRSTVVPATTTLPGAPPSVLSGGSSASALESALLLSVTSENPDVRDRILTRARLLLGTRK